MRAGLHLEILWVVDRHEQHSRASGTGFPKAPAIHRSRFTKTILEGLRTWHKITLGQPDEDWDKDHDASLTLLNLHFLKKATNKLAKN